MTRWPIMARLSRPDRRRSWTATTTASASIRHSRTTPPNAPRVSRPSRNRPRPKPGPRPKRCSIEKGPGFAGAFCASPHGGDGNGVVAFLRRTEAVGAERIGTGTQGLGDQGAGPAAAVVVGGQALAIALRAFVLRQVAGELRRIHPAR